LTTGKYHDIALATGKYHIYSSWRYFDYVTSGLQSHIINTLIIIWHR